MEDPGEALNALFSAIKVDLDGNTKVRSCLVTSFTILLVESI